MSFIVTGLLLGGLAGSGSGFAPAAEVFRTGRLIENVQSVSAPDQRFTLYLPTGFNVARPTPILYLMDPRGRARVPAKLFQGAAERFGYILISSHATSSDGPMEPNLRAMQAMWDDTHRWFTIDPHRVYLAGFSGTARTASLLAHNRPAITGIIGAGAGFHPDVRPSASTRFLYFGAVGDVDYNFHEFEALERSLAALDLPHRLERFPGPHSWMTPEVAMRAVEWMELRAMQAGTRLRDPLLIEAWWERESATAREQMQEGRVLDGARKYAAIARDFAGLRDTSGVKMAAAQIASSPMAKAQLKTREAATRRFQEWIDHGMQVIADAFSSGEAAPAIPALDLAQVLDVPRMKRAAAGHVPEEAREARRRLNKLEVELGFYLPHDALVHSEPARAAYYLSLAADIDNASPVSSYLMAQTYARLHVPEQALASLRRAVDAGFRDVTLLEADAAFRKLRGTAGYAAIVALLRNEGDSLDSLTVDRPPVHVAR